MSVGGPMLKTNLINLPISMFYWRAISPVKKSGRVEMSMKENRVTFQGILISKCLSFIWFEVHW